MPLPAALARARRVCFVHAHPDDETFVTGQLTCELADAGVAVDVVTCTRGEEGEVRPGLLAEGSTQADVVALRSAELARALDVLGVERWSWLGTPPASRDGRVRVHRDSGMAWDGDVAVAAPGTGADAFSRADVDGLVDDLLAWLEQEPADALVSYDELGTYGHPDHVRAHEVARRAADRLGIGLWQALGRTSHVAPEHVVEVSGEALARLRTASGCHPSQALLDGDDLVHVGGQRRPLSTRVGLLGPGR